MVAVPTGVPAGVASASVVGPGAAIASELRAAQDESARADSADGSPPVEHPATAARVNDNPAAIRNTGVLMRTKVSPFRLRCAETIHTTTCPPTML